jgi:Ca-activated chloride channel family protein
MQFDSEILELQELTGSIGKLQDSLNKLSEKRGYLAGSTRMYDAISAASHLELGHQLGRRAMVLLTDGDDHGSDTKLNAAIAAAQRADIMIYSVYYTSGTGNRKVLSRLSAATGGRVFTVGPDMTLHEIFATIADDMRLAYEIGYRPPPSKPDKFHKIEIRTANKSQSVQAREGYFSK